MQKKLKIKKEERRQRKLSTLSSTCRNGGNNALRWDLWERGLKKKKKKKNEQNLLLKKNVKLKKKKKEDIFKNQSLVVDKFSKTSTWHHSNKQTRGKVLR